ncbi:MAG: hypothetical protein WCG45_01595 [bacterium]
MKILFHKEIPLNYKCPRRNNLVLENSGILILQQEPFKRTIYSSGNHGFMKLPFPHVQFVLGYTTCTQDGKKKFVHHVCHDGGMRVFYSKRAFSSKEEKATVAWTDFGNNGLICTPHHYDYNLNFNSLYELAMNYINVYFSLSHYVNDFWRKGGENTDDIFNGIEKRTPYLVADFQSLYVLTNETNLSRNDLFRKMISMNSLKDSDLINEEFNETWAVANPIIKHIMAFQSAINRN